jgi:hypothetical protein
VRRGKGLTDSSASIIGVNEHHRPVALRLAVVGHADIRTDDLSGLTHEVFEVLPGGLEWELSGQILSLPPRETGPAYIPNEKIPVGGIRSSLEAAVVPASTAHERWTGAGVRDGAESRSLFSVLIHQF